ncbi:hypothetical protein Nepgr_018894 [Nepenthes gracilis]|uniref:Uncharacterized protein n=1 Tax=Nepenthes gracilis TaxID=150966 RepID=A0AAD3XTW0_NEPGR|nr:hypothetical protein Nepgr_018894 [Nepenthes gracilis]
MKHSCRLMGLCRTLTPLRPYKAQRQTSCKLFLKGLVKRMSTLSLSQIQIPTWAMRRLIRNVCPLLIKIQSLRVNFPWKLKPLALQEVVESRDYLLVSLPYLKTPTWLRCPLVPPSLAFLQPLEVLV